MKSEGSDKPEARGALVSLVRGLDVARIMKSFRYTALTGFFSLVCLLVSCATSTRNAPKSDHLMAMDLLRGSVHSKGIPREKIFYQFQLYGIPSKRMLGGVRGGYTCAWEEWELFDGFRVRATKYTYVGSNLKLTPLKNDDSFFAKGPRLMIKEKYYHEPRLEPYFDEILLFDQQGHVVSEFNLTRRTPKEKAAS